MTSHLHHSPAVRPWSPHRPPASPARVRLPDPPATGSDPTPAPIAATPSPRARGRRWARAYAVVGSIAAVSVLAHVLASYLPETGRALTHPHVGWVVLAVAAELVSMAAFSELQRTTLRAAGTSVRARSMASLTFEANALSGSLPAGSALATGYAFRRFRTWGSSVPAAGYTLVASGLVSGVAFGVLTAAAAAWAGGPSVGPLSVAAAVVPLVAVVLGSRKLRRHPATAVRMVERGSAVVDRLRRRPAGTSRTQVRAFTDASAAIRPTARTWSAALLLASVNWAADIACLLAAGRAVGAGATTLELVVLVYVAGMSVSGMPLAPGGLGVVEGAMILVLGQAGTPHALAIASVLMYRLVSYVLMVAIGWALVFVHRLRDGRRSRPLIGSVARRPGGTLGPRGKPLESINELRTEVISSGHESLLAAE